MKGGVNVKKMLLVSACVLGISVAAPVDAMMKKPTNMCEFLQYMDQKMDRMESSINQRLDQMDERLYRMENTVSFVKTQACATNEDVARIKQTLGSFDSGDCPKK